MNATESGGESRQIIIAWAELLLLASCPLVWLVFHVPFWTCVGHYVVVGMLVYTLLRLAIAILGILAGVQPRWTALTHATRFFATVGLAVLWFVAGFSFWQAFLTWIVSYFILGVIAQVVERRLQGRSRQASIPEE